MITNVAHFLQVTIYASLFHVGLARNLTVAIVGYSIWRFYRFTLQPIIWPSEPKERPYWVPLLGHLISFLMDNNRTTFNGRRTSRRAYILTLMGTRTCFVTSEKDAMMIHQNPTHVSHDPTLKHVLSCFGMTKEGIATFWAEQPTGGLNTKPLAHRCAAILAQEFSPGGTEQSLQSVLSEQISDATLWEKICPDAVSRNDNGTRTVSLSRWARDVYAVAFAKSFFGEQILNVNPHFLQSLHVFDDKSWMPIYGASGPWCGDMSNGLGRIQKTLMKYFALPESQRSDGSNLVKKMEKALRTGGMKDADVASYISMIYWGANTNIWKASFWCLGYLVYDPSLLAVTQAEISPIMSDKSHFNLTSRLRSCPQFMSVFYETLRTTTASASSREATKTFALGDAQTQIRQGTRVAIMYRHMQMCKDTFGYDADVFKGDRFLARPDLAKSPNFNPFGGGSGVCPGRYLAQTGVLTFVAYVLYRYRMELADPAAKMPQIDTKTPPIGTMYSIGKEDIALQIERRHS